MSTVDSMSKATIVPIMLEQLAIHAEGHETISIFRNTAKKCIRVSKSATFIPFFIQALLYYSAY